MKLFKSKAGFTLIELLVVIGILAVLAAIAIPSVAGLIDRANVSADKTNSNEMTNAIERFASEYELYCQDIASGVIKDENGDGKPDDDLDSAQGRVYNVTGVVSRSGIEGLEIAQNTTATNGVAQIYRDTKYPTNVYTLKKIVENYTKTSSSTFEPKQSDMHYWYSPDCGVVVFAEPNANTDVEKYLNSQILSGMDAKGNKLDASTQWVDLTLEEVNNGAGGTPTPPVPQLKTMTLHVKNSSTFVVNFEDGMTWKEWLTSAYNTTTATTCLSSCPCGCKTDSNLYFVSGCINNGACGHQFASLTNISTGNSVSADSAITEGEYNFSYGGPETHFGG